MLGAALALVACGPQKADRERAADPSADRGAVRADARIACAAPGAATLARACTIDREQTAGGQVLTLRRPDGGFRRLTITADGRGVIAADGARPATVTIIGPSEIEVAVAGERYRLPATMKRTR